MNSPESGRQSLRAPGIEDARRSLDQALAAVDRAQAKRDYESARADELLPEIKREAGLKIQEEGLRTKLEAAIIRIGRVRQMAELRVQTRALEEKIARRSGTTLPPAVGEDAELTAATAEVERLRADHKLALEELSACSGRIRSGEEELRRRFQLAEG